MLVYKLKVHTAACKLAIRLLAELVNATAVEFIFVFSLLFFLKKFLFL